MTQNQPQVSPIRLILGGIVLLVMVAGVLGVLVLLAPRSYAVQLSTGKATVLTPPQPLADFTLTGTDGAAIGLDDLRGKYTLMSFGYTHCPDVCPMTLTEYKRVKRELGDQSDEVNFVFVSVDGERDTPDLLGRYLGRFDPDFIGMTTDDDAHMREIADMFNVFYERRTLENTQAAYIVDHTASTFLINPRGEIIALYPFGTPPVDIATDIANLL
jgi:protein SCO1/2